MMEKKQKKYFVCLILSLLFHFMWLSPSFFKSVWETPLDKPSDYIEVEYLETAPQMQIVEQDAQSINEVEPEKAKYYSQKNQKVNQETRAANSGKFNNQIQKASRSPKQPKKVSQKKLPNLKDLKPDDGWFAEEESSSEGSLKDNKFAKSSDYLKDVDKGKQTVLNTREFVYYSYYQRIRRQLQQYWEPSIKKKFSKLMRKGRRIASTRDHLTKVLITLNKEGTLVRIQVLEESGLRDLDDSAIEAFQEAAPFPNPPHGIVEQDGTVKIRWDFVVEA